MFYKSSALKKHTQTIEIYGSNLR